MPADATVVGQAPEWYGMVQGVTVVSSSISPDVAGAGIAEAMSTSRRGLSLHEQEAYVSRQLRQWRQKATHGQVVAAQPALYSNSVTRNFLEGTAPRQGADSGAELRQVGASSSTALGVLETRQLRLNERTTHGVSPDSSPVSKRAASCVPLGPGDDSKDFARAGGDDRHVGGVHHEDERLRPTVNQAQRTPAPVRSVYDDAAIKGAASVTPPISEADAAPSPSQGQPQPPVGHAARPTSCAQRRSREDVGSGQNAPGPHDDRSRQPPKKRVRFDATANLGDPSVRAGAKRQRSMQLPVRFVRAQLQHQLNLQLQVEQLQLELRYYRVEQERLSAGLMWCMKRLDRREALRPTGVHM